MKSSANEFKKTMQRWRNDSSEDGPTDYYCKLTRHTLWKWLCSGETPSVQISCEEFVARQERAIQLSGLGTPCNWDSAVIFCYIIRSFLDTWKPFGSHFNTISIYKRGLFATSVENAAQTHLAPPPILFLLPPIIHNYNLLREFKTSRHSKENQLRDISAIVNSFPHRKVVILCEGHHPPPFAFIGDPLSPFLVPTFLAPTVEGRPVINTFIFWGLLLGVHRSAINRSGQTGSLLLFWKSTVVEFESLPLSGARDKEGS